MERYTISHPQIHEINVFESPRYTAKGAAQHVAKHVKNFPSSAVTYATGNTMIPFSRALVRTAVDFGRTHGFHLDEYWKYPPKGKYSFVKFVKNRYVRVLGINPHNMEYINGLAPDPVIEAERYDGRVSRRKIAKCIIGFGPRGHIGFTESSGDEELFNLRTHYQQLSDETITRDRKRGQDTPPAAITLGPANIAEAENIVGIAYGEDKGKILGEALYGPITPLNPASSLRRENVGCNVTLFIDKEAAKEIESYKRDLKEKRVP